jgi:hypothetical protein
MASPYLYSTPIAEQTPWQGTPMASGDVLRAALPYPPASLDDAIGRKRRPPRGGMCSKTYEPDPRDMGRLLRARAER